MDSADPDGALGKHRRVYEQLGAREPSTVVEAKAVLERVREGKGYLDEETLRDVGTLGRRTRETILSIVRDKRETEAAYTKSVSEQLYSSKYRFLYELIQNADDSSYERLPAGKSVPCLRIEITPSALIVDTNEDGFTRANIEAICATGHSSKKASETDDHIGEKGFGFKSVFAIANEVHVQSGLWSFQFKHQQGEDGLGMVTPLDAMRITLPTGFTTRITLHYTDEAKQEYTRLIEAVHDLPDTVILFLQRLQRIQVRIVQDAMPNETITITKRYDKKPLQCTIARLRESAGVRDNDRCTYLLFQARKKDMPFDERRKNRKDVKIDLAFPIDPDTRKPKLEKRGQYVFAYLPLQRLHQLQFLIQTDFITSASRESVIDCPWNSTLCDAVARMFVGIVVDTFSKYRHPLEFLWLEYLPSIDMEGPWKTLRPSILEMLRNEAVLQTWKSRCFKKPSQLRRVISCALHQGEPILPDKEDEMYLAPKYAVRHSGFLDELGVKELSWDEIVNLLEADEYNAKSRLRTTISTDPWHEAFADLMLQVSIKGSRQALPKLKKLAIIPLTGASRWVAAAVFGANTLHKIYFPFTGATPIPESLPLTLLNRNAAQSAKRKAFYKAMGVIECDPSTVVQSMRKSHELHETTNRISLISQLQYLFRQGIDIDAFKYWLRVPLMNGMIGDASSRNLYFPSNEEFDMYRLLPTQTNVLYLSKSLVDAEPSTVRIQDRDWNEWIAAVTGARNYPLLRCDFSLSPEIQAVLRRRPEKFLSTIKAHWTVYQNDAYLVGDELRQCLVPCKTGTSEPLHKTFLPTAAILDEAARLGLCTDALPLLNLPDSTLDEAAYRSWKFLEELGARSKPDLVFYMLAVHAMKDKNKMAEAYEGIARVATIQDYEVIRDFSDTPTIFNPQTGRFVTRKKCVTYGPGFLTHKFALSQWYPCTTSMRNFFETILEVPKTTLQDVLNEIVVRCGGPKDTRKPANLNEIYTYLNTEAKTAEDWNLIRTTFTAKTLVLGDNDTWHKLSTCLWGSPLALTGFQDLSILYKDLESFFVRHLHVRKPTPEILINDVKRLAEQATPPIDKIRTHLIEIGRMLATGPITHGVTNALSRVKDVKFLPKKIDGGTTTLVGVADEFFICDHQRYGDAMVKQNILLDFCKDEVQDLHAVFKNLGLTGRYLSAMVKEVSTVGEDAHEHESLSKQMQAKAYALYCCAAKYKSAKALRGEHSLFEQLSQMTIYTTDKISTDLVLTLRNKEPIRVQSNRSVVHHDVSDGKIKLYVPTSHQQRRSCFRSQVPEVLTNVLCVGSSATFNISSIVLSSIQDLDDILSEHDISPVVWIKKPVIDIKELEDEECSSQSTLNGDVRPPSSLSSRLKTFLNFSSNLASPGSSPPRPERVISEPSREFVISAPPSQYHQFIAQLVKIAQQASHGYVGGESTVTRAAREPEKLRDFDFSTTFGYGYNVDVRVGAAGEGYVFALLSALELPKFTVENWPSTIRDMLAARETIFAGLTAWEGLETSDFVYTDRHGQLTRWLRDKCEGDFPAQIPETRDLGARPIKYYLEVKTTAGASKKQFHLSASQYERMQSLRLGRDRDPDEVYVIFRVHNLISTGVGMKIYVDPMRHQGEGLNFEAGQWFVSST